MSLRDDAFRIWKSGVQAVDSADLVQNHIRADGEFLQICDQQISCDRIRHVEAVGAGKAGSGMATGLEAALQPIATRFGLSGWINVPADCVRPLSHIHLHAARPAGVNEPTAAGVSGTSEILRRVSSLGPDDLCLVLLSGGGSALLCQPVAEISLADKLAVTRLLAADGAPIEELNCVRTQLSRIKGGRLAAACTAGRLIALIISDVIGDPLDVIASGPTVNSVFSPADALKILRRRQLLNGSIPQAVVDYLEKQAAKQVKTPPALNLSERTCQVTNRLIGSNQTAVSAASAAAEGLGYQVVSLGSENQREAAEEGHLLIRRLQELRERGRGGSGGIRGICLLSGGEPTVKLRPSAVPRKGGRNQELVLAAVSAAPGPAAWKNLVLLSGGTDGEDGPTDAAGAVADEDLVRLMHERQVSADGCLSINNSYAFFDQLGGLLRTGPTHTNVMDLRVGLVGCAG